LLGSGLYIYIHTYVYIYVYNIILILYNILILRLWRYIDEDDEWRRRAAREQQTTMTTPAPSENERVCMQNVQRYIYGWRLAASRSISAEVEGCGITCRTRAARTLTSLGLGKPGSSGARGSTAQGMAVTVTFSRSSSSSSKQYHRQTTPRVSGGDEMSRSRSR